MWQRLRQMLIKEFIQLLRDPRMRFSLVIPPIIQMVIFGYAATFDVNRISTAVLDLDHSQESRELISRFAGNGRFQIRTLDGRDQITDLIDRARIAVAIQIHPGFAQALRKGQTAPLQVILDGTNSNTSLIALGYINQIASGFAADYQDDRIRRIAPQLAATLPRIEIQERAWYNPNLESSWFFVPGLVGTLTLIMVTTLTAFAVVREREIGTLEQILVTPIRPAEFILGKTVPFFIVGLVDVTLIALAGTLWFQVPLRGNLIVLLLGTTLFLLSMLGVGLLISSICSTQQQAFAAGFFFIMPAITLSGFGFPLTSIPVVLQWASYLDPLRFFVIVSRSVFLKGVGLDVLWPQMAAMAILAAVLLSVSVMRFRKSLD